MEKLKCKIIMLVCNTTSPIIKSLATEELILDEIHGRSWFAGYYQHLYLTSNCEIKEGDWFWDKLLNVVCKTDSTTDFQYINEITSQVVLKIEATTDPSLGLPLIPQSFIEKYVKKQGKIDEVMIEMEELSGMELMLERENYCPKNTFPWIKTRPDNTVIVSKVKDTWTRDEVSELMKRSIEQTLIHPDTFLSFESECCLNTEKTNEWINNNL